MRLLGLQRTGASGRRASLTATLQPASWPNSALAAALVALLVASWAMNWPSHLSGSLVVGGVLSLVPYFMVPWRPKIPELLLVAAIACQLAAAALGISGGADVVAIVAVYTIAAERTRRAAVLAVLAAGASECASVLLALGSATLLAEAGALAVWASLGGGVAILGRTMKHRRTYVRNLVVRTEDLERERRRLELEREALAREAVAVERARIARELHDVVAHHVSVMVLQAGAAQATLPPDATVAAQSIEAIRLTGREAMAEMRRLLGLLRSEESLDGAPAEGAGVERTPQPGLADLETLAERTREAGLTVDVEVQCERKLPAAVDLSAYRIVQEALTNTLRHAGVGAHVRVCADAGPTELVVEVVDDGHGRRSSTVERPANEVGHGLVGMRERVVLFGGSLEAGARAGGGYRVMARFPLETAAAEVATA
jgi:signal transduction histidine kinase